MVSINRFTAERAYKMLKILTILVVVFGIVSTVHGRCGEVYESEVTEADKEIILATHNELRRKLANGEVDGQPRACNMKTLKWDNEIAALAQEVANTCQFDHVKQTDRRWGELGQNLERMGTSLVETGGDWKKVVQEWISEIRKYRYSARYQRGTGHYTQVIWANTEYIGCGYISYKDRINDMNRKLYVCNYGPSGNYQGQFPYEADC